jgi:hypothetical protein
MQDSPMYRMHTTGANNFVAKQINYLARLLFPENSGGQRMWQDTCHGNMLGVKLRFMVGRST